MSLVIFCLLFSSVDYVPVKGEIIWGNEPDGEGQKSPFLQCVLKNKGMDCHCLPTSNVGEISEILNKSPEVCFCAEIVSVLVPYWK